MVESMEHFLAEFFMEVLEGISEEFLEKSTRILLEKSQVGFFMEELFEELLEES